VVPSIFQCASSTTLEFLLEPSFYYCMDDLFALDGYIYLDTLDYGGNLEHSTWRFVKHRCHTLGASMSI
jgi:hypothetical protein